VFERADWWGNLPRLDQGRLRVTWLATHLLRSTPLRLLCAAAGLSSTRTLFDLLPLLPAADMSDAPALLRGGGQR
jgi:hypothetical protein